MRIRKCSALLFGGLVAIAVVAASCSTDEEDLPFAPGDCERNKPALGFLNVRLTTNAENESVHVMIYEGDIEDGIVVGDEFARQTLVRFELPADVTYSGIAEYAAGSLVCEYVDDAKIHTSSEDYRDGTCWTVHDGDMDLRLGDCPP